jgi:hypothetical protein
MALNLFPCNEELEDFTRYLSPILRWEYVIDAGSKHFAKCLVRLFVL